MALATAVLASCGGGGSSGGGAGTTTISFAQESAFSGAIGPISAQAAYDRGHAGNGVAYDAEVFA